VTHPIPSTVLYSRLMAKARLRHLQLLVAVADHGHLKHAADEVGVSQPSATQALAELEQLLEVRLFERHSRGMRMTAAGSVLIPVIRHVLEALHAATGSLAALQEGASGLIRVGVIAAVASAVLGERVLRFCARHPDMRVEIVEDAGAHLLQELLAGSLDLVLGRRPQPVPPKLHFESLRPDEAIVVAGPGHPLAGRRGLSLRDLSDYPWMRAAPGVWTREVFDALFEEAGIRPRLHQVSLASLGPLPEILRDDRTLAMVPTGIGRSLCRWKQAVVLDAHLGTPRGEIGLLCAPEALREPVCLEFIGALRAESDGEDDRPGVIDGG
jgi:molybdate transport repressor ModE-like protein